jgi:hypothetical protein
MNMKRSMVAILTVGTLALFSTSASAQHVLQQSILRQNQPGVSQEAYNRCYQLALKRGLTVSKGDRYWREVFISQCLQGKIPF